MAKSKKSKAFDMNSVLESAAKKTDGKKSKNKVPVVDVPELTQAIEDFDNAQKEIKTQESIAAKAFGIIGPQARDLKLRCCRDSKKFLNSIKLNGSGTEVTYTQQARFSKIDQDQKPLLQKVCDDEKVGFGRYFSPIPEISLNNNLSDEQRETAVRKLIQAFGAEWTQFFDVKYPIVVSPQLLKDEPFDNGAAAILERLGPGSSANVIRPWSPSLRS